MFLLRVLCYLFLAVEGGEEYEAQVPPLALGFSAHQNNGGMSIRSTVDFHLSWQGVLMVNMAHTYYQYMNVCQRYSGIDYTIDYHTARTLCQWNNFHKLDSVGLLDYNAYPWAKNIRAGVRGVKCNTSGRCEAVYIRNFDEDCESYKYYTTLSCSCDPGYKKTATGCVECEGGRSDFADVTGNDTTCNCIPNYEFVFSSNATRCAPCDRPDHFTLGKYNKCTACPPDGYAAKRLRGATDDRTGCRCEAFRPYMSDFPSKKGWVYETNTCQLCPKDWYRSSTSGRCVACPDGRGTQGLEGMISVESCVRCASNSVYMGSCVNKVTLPVLVILGVAVLVVCFVVRFVQKRKMRAVRQDVVTSWNQQELDNINSNLNRHATPGHNFSIQLQQTRNNNNSSRQQQTATEDNNNNRLAVTIVDADTGLTVPTAPQQPSELSESVPPTYNSVWQSSDQVQPPSFPMCVSSDLDAGLQRYTDALEDATVFPAVEFDAHEDATVFPAFAPPSYDQVMATTSTSSEPVQ